MANMPKEKRNMTIEITNMPIESKNMTIGMKNMPIESRNMTIEFQNMSIESENMSIENEYMPIKSKLKSVIWRAFLYYSKCIKHEQKTSYTLNITFIAGSSYNIIKKTKNSVI